MRDLSYTHEKLHNALEALALGDGPLRDRLFSAYLAMHTLSEADMPDEPSRKRFAELYGRLTAIQDETGRDGHVRATLSQASELDLRDLAKSIVDMHEQLPERY